MNGLLKDFRIVGTNRFGFGESPFLDGIQKFWKGGGKEPNKDSKENKIVLVDSARSFKLIPSMFRLDVLFLIMNFLLFD